MRERCWQDFFSILLEQWTITEGQNQSQFAVRKRGGGGKKEAEV